MVAEFGGEPWNHRPAWTNAIHSTAAVTASVRGKPRDFIFEGASKTVSDGRFRRRIIRMARFANTPAVEAINTKFPRFCFCTIRRNSRVVKRLWSGRHQKFSAIASDISCIGTSRVSHEPALAINESTRPKRFITRANNFLTSASRVRSAWTLKVFAAPALVADFRQLCDHFGSAIPPSRLRSQNLAQSPNRFRPKRPSPV